MTQAKLSKLVTYLGSRMDDHNKTESEFDRGAYMAFAISKIMVERIVFDILDQQLSNDLELE